MQTRTILDRAQDLWDVEPAGETRADGRSLLRFRHEMGYELVVAVPGSLATFTDDALLRTLERARRRGPRRELQEAA